MILHALLLGSTARPSGPQEGQLLLNPEVTPRLSKNPKDESLVDIWFFVVIVDWNKAILIYKD